MNKYMDKSNLWRFRRLRLQSTN